MSKILPNFEARKNGIRNFTFYYQESVGADITARVSGCGLHCDKLITFRTFISDCGMSPLGQGPSPDLPNNGRRPSIDRYPGRPTNGRRPSIDRHPDLDRTFPLQDRAITHLMYPTRKSSGDYEQQDCPLAPG